MMALHVVQSKAPSDIYPSSTRMWNLIFFSALTVFNVYILYVSGDQNCDPNLFIRTSTDLLFSNALLLEASVSSRAECISLSHLHDGCNLILYNPSTALCRLHSYDHANDVGVTVEGWENWAMQCTEPPTEPNCDDTSLLDSCESCVRDNTCTGYDMCTLYETSFTNTVGANIDLNYDFDVGMVVKVKGQIRNDIYSVGTCLHDSGDGISFLCVEFKLGSWCSTFTVVHDDDCAGVLPPIDASEVVFTFQLTGVAIKILVDGVFIKQYQDDITRNQLEVYGFDDIDQVQIISVPDSCN